MLTRSEWHAESITPVEGRTEAGAGGQGWKKKRKTTTRHKAANTETELWYQQNQPPARVYAPQAIDWSSCTVPGLSAALSLSLSVAQTANKFKQGGH